MSRWELLVARLGNAFGWRSAFSAALITQAQKKALAAEVPQPLVKSVSQR